MTQAVTPELLAVTDADREAACAAYRHFRYGQPPLYTNIAAGRIDHDPIVQAFARHRLASLADAPAQDHLATRQQPEAGREGIRDIVARAYADGATECHSYWKQCRPDIVFDREPDFTEAASDYASHIVVLPDPDPAATRLAVPTGVGREEVALLIESMCPDKEDGHPIGRQVEALADRILSLLYGETATGMVDCSETADRAQLLSHAEAGATDPAASTHSPRLGE